MIGSRTRRVYLIPGTVLLIGMLSIALLLWVDRVSERLNSESAHANAMMDIQIHAASVHLWLEQALGGDTDVDVDRVMADLDQGIKLLDAVLEGGDTEHGPISKPLSEPRLRERAEAMRPLLAEFRTIAETRLKDPENSGIGSLIDHRFDTIFKEIQSKARGVEDTIERERAGHQQESEELYGTILFIWTLIVMGTTVALWRYEHNRRKGKEQLMQVNQQLLAQAEELAGHREHLAELVEKRTVELQGANTLLHAEIAERRRKEEALKETELQIRELSRKLLNAQEVERKRISMELHDELGQALNVMKLRIRAIERELRTDQNTVREGCEALLDYMNLVIEDVRRLSQALSPTILEDLGLTSAVRWLIRSIGTGGRLRVASDLEDIDDLFPRQQWITIYRVFQEALTNAAKHADALNVSVVIARAGDRIECSVVDDGKGFEKEGGMPESGTKGLGLATMAERMRMLGGDLSLYSRPGEGTRISFSIPVGREAE